MAIFMRIQGIQGNVTAIGHEGTIAIHSMHYVFLQPVSMPVGCPQNRVRSRPEFSEVVLTKSTDDATSSLLSIAYAGKPLSNVQCKVVVTGDDLSALVNYQFSNVIISRYETSVGAGGGPVETVGMQFTRIQINYQGRDRHHKPCSPRVVGYDLETAGLM